MRRTPAEMLLSYTTLQTPISPVRVTCVPPHNSRLNDPSPTETTRTLSPYFSPNSAMAPVLSASSMLITFVRISRIGEDLFVDNALDVFHLIAVERSVMCEIEAQARGFHDAAGLLHMFAENIAQRGVEKCVAVWLRIVGIRLAGSTTARTAAFLVRRATVRTRCTFSPFTGAYVPSTSASLTPSRSYKAPWSPTCPPASA